jgi:spore germination protein GerM
LKTARKKRKTLSLVVPFLIIALVFGVMVWKRYSDSVPQTPQPGIHKSTGVQSAILFFVADGTRLEREARDIEPCEETTACLKDVLEELFNGPAGDLTDPMPEGAMLNSVLIQGDSAQVDVNSNFVSEMPSGSSAEMMAVYAIVNTVCVNFPQITSVRLTVEGELKKYLKHLDLSEPLKADYSLELKSGQENLQKAEPKKQ